MRRWLLALWLAAAAPAFAQAPAIVVGAVLPASGQLADLGEDMRKALVLWQERCNAGGGLLGRERDHKAKIIQDLNDVAERTSDPELRQQARSIISQLRVL